MNDQGHRPRTSEHELFCPGLPDSKDSFLSPHCALRGPQQAAAKSLWKFRREKARGLPKLTHCDQGYLTPLPAPLVCPVEISWVSGHP